jgi:hypothetical protein
MAKSKTETAKEKNEETLDMGRLFLKLKENWDLRREIAAFSKYLRHPVWAILPHLPEGYVDLRKTEVAMCQKSGKDTEPAPRRTC